MNALPHLMVADAVWRRLELLPTTRGHTLLGGIAPDAHRILPEVGYRALHFRSSSQHGLRFSDFLHRHLEPALLSGPADEQAFWMGWACHIVADGVWRRMLRAELPELWRACLDRRNPDAPLLRAGYQQDCDRLDVSMARQYPQYVAELRRTLRSAEPAYETGPLGRETLNHWVGTITTTALPPAEPPARELGEDYYVGHDFLLRAMEGAREEALTILQGVIRRVAYGAESGLLQGL